jgi:hypothetical protein
MLSLTQRTHAIGLWAARNTAFSKMDPLCSAFLAGVQRTPSASRRASM